MIFGDMIPLMMFGFQKASFPSAPRRAMAYFTLNGNAYAGLGYDNNIFQYLPSFL